MEKGYVSDGSKLTMSPEELAIELMTSGQRLSGGREEAKRLLKSLHVQWGRQIANRQRNAHDEAWPPFHHGRSCQPGSGCHVGEIIELAEVME